MASDGNQAAQTIQRVKVGMTGLASVFLLIAFASAVFSWANKEQPVAVVGASKAEVVANLTQPNESDPAAGDQPARDPLAELGVAPSAAPDAATAANTATPVKPLPPARR